MYHVLFDYYEYSDSGDWLGENTDHQEFTHFDEAEAFISSLPNDVFNVVLTTDLAVHTCAPPRSLRLRRRPSQFLAA